MSDFQRISEEQIVSLRESWSAEIRAVGMSHAAGLLVKARKNILILLDNLTAAYAEIDRLEKCIAGHSDAAVYMGGTINKLETERGRLRSLCRSAREDLRVHISSLIMTVEKDPPPTRAELRHKIEPLDGVADRLAKEAEGEG